MNAFLRRSTARSAIGEATAEPLTRAPAVRRRSTDSAGRSTGVCPYHGRRHKSARAGRARRADRSGPGVPSRSPGNSRIKGNA